MRKFIQRNKDVLAVAAILFAWRIYSLSLQLFTDKVPLNFGYLGFLRIANFDGVYYLSISQYGYKGLDQSFFPLFPILVHTVITATHFSPISSAIIVVIVSLFIALYTFCKLIKLDSINGNYIWALIFFLSFPTSFFFGMIYTESLFLCLTLLAFYFTRRKKYILASIFGMFASATRIVGIFLLPALMLEIYDSLKKKENKSIRSYLPLLIIPFGLLSYMGYLWHRYGDPLLFVHIQPAFGAGRSGGSVVLLPQVLYRYVKIMTTVSTSTLTFWISCLEFSMFFIGLMLLYLAYKKGVRRSYVLFSILVFIFPTLSGTLSSLPRYMLCSFAIFIYLGTIKNKIIKISLIIICLILQYVLATLFLQGYFVS